MKRVIAALGVGSAVGIVGTLIGFAATGDSPQYQNSFTTGTAVIVASIIGLGAAIYWSLNSTMAKTIEQRGIWITDLEKEKRDLEGQITMRDARIAAMEAAPRDPAVATALAAITATLTTITGILEAIKETMDEHNENAPSRTASLAGAIDKVSDRVARVERRMVDRPTGT